MHRLAVVLAMMLAIGSAEARTGERVQNFLDQPNVGAASSNLTEARVRRAITTAVERQHWQIVEEGPGRLIATYNLNGKHTMTVTILWMSPAPSHSAMACSKLGLSICSP